MPTTNDRVRYEGLTARDLALVAVFAGLVAALSVLIVIPLPFSPAPITLQTLGVMLAPSLLGWKRGTLAVGAVLVLGLAGLPLFAGGMGGIGVLARPSAGFILSWILAALIIGVLTDKTAPGSFLKALFINVLGGILVIYAIGIPWMAAVSGSGALAAVYAMLAFLPGDLAKAVFSAVVTSTVMRTYPVPPAGRRVTVDAAGGRGVS